MAREPAAESGARTVVAAIEGEPVPPAPDVPAAPSPAGIREGTAEYRRAALALFLAGFATFSLLYCVQPLLPAFAHSFGVSPAESSLALSLTTGSLAFSILAAGAYSQALGRRGLMFTSMAVASILNIVAAVMPSWHGLLAARALEGLVLGGVPAVAMAWLAEEIDPDHLGRTMGIYVAGTAFGGMSGRVGIGIMTDLADGGESWRMALAAWGGLCLACAIGFVALLPRSRNFTPRPGFDPLFHLRAWGGHLRNAGLLRLYIISFVLMGIFVTLFNYITFRLAQEPYGLSQTQLSLIFLAYGFGVVSSAVSGGLVGRFGARRLLAAGLALIVTGILLTLAASLAVIVAGISVMTAGFFIGHAVASSLVGTTADGNKGHAASLYLLFYYLGSSAIGSAGGWFWEHGGWMSIVLLTGGLAATGMLLVAGLSPARRANPPRH